MKKLVLLVLLSVSMNSFANSVLSQQLTTGVLNAFQQHSTNLSPKLYGGQDFSRSAMANTNESLRYKQTTLIG